MSVQKLQTINWLLTWNNFWDLCFARPGGKLERYNQVLAGSGCWPGAQLFCSERGPKRKFMHREAQQNSCLLLILRKLRTLWEPKKVHFNFFLADHHQKLAVKVTAISKIFNTSLMSSNILSNNHTYTMLVSPGLCCHFLLWRTKWRSDKS